MTGRTRTATLAAALSVALAVPLAGCGQSGPSAEDAAKSRGPIKIWYSNNEQEIAWGEQMVQAWNAEHPDEKISAQQIPAGKTSEEVIGAAITAGNAPCLVFNTSPAAVPQFQKQGGLVPLDDFDDGRDYVTERTGDRAEQYVSPDGKLYQLPWKANPVMIFYNKAAFAKAKIDPNRPPLATHDQFLDTARKVVAGRGAQYAIWPAPSSEFFQSWFDFYPLYIAETGGKALVEDEKATFDSEEGRRVADLWRTIYAEKLASPEQYNGDAFPEGKAAMAIVGPWAVATYKDKVDWGVAPVPTSSGTAAEEISTFSDAKNVAMYSACENRATAWDVLKFASSTEQDEKLLIGTGQMPMRTDLAGTYPDWVASNPAYATFVAQADRTVEVPNIPGSITAWQEFRDGWVESVVFGKKPVDQSLTESAEKVDAAVEEG